MSSVAVVLLNWNGRTFLENFLPGVVENSPGCEIIVADNHSSDGSVSWIEQNLPQVRVIVFSENLGFCKGYNTALKQVKADYYLLLNTDVETTPGWVAPLLELMESDESIAVCQPKVRSYHRRAAFEYAGAAGGFIDSLGYPFCRGRLFETVEEDRGQYDDERRVFWASGACFFVRAGLFHRFGGFDERFFAHMEEIDLCWRMGRSGYKIFYSGRSVVYHVGGGALPQSNPQKTYLNFRNNLLMLLKNLPSRELWWKVPLRIGLDWAAVARFFLTGHFRKGLVIIKAHFDAIKLTSGNRRFGESGTYHENINLNDIVYPGSALMAYFLRNKKKFSQLDF